jgi:hypothetical protein
MEFLPCIILGRKGLGLGLLLLKNGVIAGADAAGATYDGTYTELDDGTAEGSVTMTVPPGVQLVTGATAATEPIVHEIPLRLPANLGGGNALPLQTPTGPINIIFKRLRDVP